MDTCTRSMLTNNVLYVDYPAAPPPIKRGRKRSLSTMLPSAYQHTATSVTAATAGMAGLGLYGRSPRKGQAPRGSGGALGGIPPGAAVYENCITSYGAGTLRHAYYIWHACRRV